MIKYDGRTLMGVAVDYNYINTHSPHNCKWLQMNEQLMVVFVIFTSTYEYAYIHRFIWVVCIAETKFRKSICVLLFILCLRIISASEKVEGRYSWIEYCLLYLLAMMPPSGSNEACHFEWPNWPHCTDHTAQSLLTHRHLLSDYSTYMGTSSNLTSLTNHYHVSE